MLRRPAESSRPPALLIFAVTATGITTNTLISPGLPEILAGLDAPTSLAGLILAAGTLPGVVVAPTIGVLADRYGRRELLVPCLVLFGTAGGLAGLAPNLPALLVGRFAQGAGSAGLINLAVVLIGDHWQDSARARMMGHNAAVLTVSLALLPPVGGVLTDLGGWRTPFALYPVAWVTAMVVWRRLPPAAARTVSLRDQLADARVYLRQRSVTGALTVAVILFVVIFGLVLTALPVYAEQSFGLSASPRGMLLGLPAITSTVAALAVGRATERLGRRRMLVGAGMVFVVAYGLMGVAANVGLLVVGMLVHGTAEGLLLPSLQDLIASAGPAASRGTLVAVFVGAARAGQTLGPLLASAGLELAGGQATFLIGAAVAAAMPLVLRASLPATEP